MFILLFSILPFLVCVFWIITLIADYRNWHYRENIWLVVFLAITSVLYAAHFIFFNHRISWLPVSDVCYSFANLAVYPLFYFYISHLSKHNPISTIHKAEMLAPALFCAVAIAVLYALMTPQQTTEFIHNFLYNNLTRSDDPIIRYQIIAHLAARIIFAFIVILSLYKSIQSIKELNRIIKSNYANIEDKDTSPYLWLLCLMAGASIIGFLANALGRYIFANHESLLGIPSLIFSSILYGIGFLGFKMNFSIKDIINDDIVLAADNNDDIVLTTDNNDNTAIPKIREQIEAIMASEKLFLQPNLKINDIARIIGTNRNYIYQAINEQLGASFNDYINKQRIDYAVQAMRQNPALSISVIALQSGFTSQASFYRNFKKFVGCSPRSFIPSIGKEHS